MSYLCYHHNDMDGKGAADQVYRYLTRLGVKCFPSMFIMRGYDEPFNEDDYNNKTVFIVDLSFTKESIKKLYTICEGASSVTWIDHHESSKLCIEDDDIRKKLNNYGNLTYFVNTELCGAMLSFLYFNSVIDSEFKSEESIDFSFNYNGSIIQVTDPEANTKKAIVPNFLLMIDLWDRWAYGEDNRPVWFNYGVGLHNTSIFAYKTRNDMEKSYNDRFWTAVESASYVSKIIEEGKIAKKYADSQSQKRVSSSAYEAIIDGHKSLVLNSDGNSMVFGNKIKDYDIVCLWTYNGKTGKYQYSLYSDNKVNCATIASKLNPAGGGHPGAAGFSSDKLLFTKH